MASVSIPEFKVILCGEYGVGKTSLFRRYATNTYIETIHMNPIESRNSTLGMDHMSKTFDVTGLKTIKIQLWDTGGLERVASITNSYYKFAEAALLVFSLNSIESFHSLSQHLLEILSLAENAKIFLIGNKKDLTPHEVQDSDIELFLEQFPRLNGVYKMSCKTNEGVQEMFNDIAEKLASINYKANFDALRLHENESNQNEDKGCCSAK